MTKPAIGEIVLFKIDPSDFGLWRPLLVTMVSDDGSVEGELFLSWERDKRAEWPTKFLFFGLNAQHRTVEVRAVKEGEEVGNYKRRTTDSFYKEITERFMKLEGQLAAAMKAPVQPARALTPEKRVK